MNGKNSLTLPYFSDLFSQNKPKIIKNGIRLAIVNVIFIAVKWSQMSLITTLAVLTLIAFVGQAALYHLRSFGGQE